MHQDRLIAALNKYYRPLTEREFMEDMDIPAVQNAICIAGFSKEVEDWIWETNEEDVEPFKIFV